MTITSKKGTGIVLSMPPVTIAPDYAGFAYAAVVAAGGIAGYAKKKSMVSLAMGVIFGGILAIGAYLASQDPMNVGLSTIASAALTAVMGSRYFKSRKVMPAGMVALVSLLMFTRYALRLIA